jgi:hypothetical protein
MTKDVTTTLYAVSTIPKTVVAAQGIRIFFGFQLMLTFYLVLSVASTLVLGWLQTSLYAVLSEMTSSLDKGWATLLTNILTVLLFVFISFVTLILFIGVVGVVRPFGARLGALLFRILFRIGELFWAWPFLLLMIPSRSPRWLWINAFVFNFLAFVATIVIVSPLSPSPLKLPGEELVKFLITLPLVWFPLQPLSQLSNWKDLIIDLGVIYALLSLSYLPVTLTGKPPLPKVRVVLESETVEGDLLAHSEGHWHFFDQQHTLKAIPDGKVQDIQITGNSDIYRADLEKVLGESFSFRGRGREPSK